MINIKSFCKKKGNKTTTSSSSSSGGFANSAVNTTVNGVYLWGQYHDHTNDVDGDITTSGGITATGDITTQGTITGNQLISNSTITATGNITTQGDISADDAIFNGDMQCVDINCVNINAANDIVTDSIEAVEGDITNLVCDFLTVTKQAHFFELIIDKIKANAGQVILSAANAIIDKVTPVTDGYKLYWRRGDAVTHKKVGNEFQYQDQVRCQTFNVHNGTTFNAENKYYWRLVTDTGAETTEIDGEQVECNYIEVSDIDKDGTSIPEVGDEIVQLGNRTDTTRQNAIILSAVTSPDPNVTAPSIAQYKGIDSYTLNGRVLNQIASNGSTFTGNFMVVNGSSVDNVLNLISGTLPTIVTDSDASFVIADSNSKMYALTDAQALPTNIKVYEGDTLIPFSSWTSNSYVKNGTQSPVLFDNPTVSGAGLYIASATDDNDGGANINWSYQGAIPDGDYTINSHNILISIEYTVSGQTKSVQKNIPMSVITSGATIAGADAEFDKLIVESADFTVTLQDKLSVAFHAHVQHIKGDTITTLSDLTDYSCDMVFSNGTLLNANKSTYFYYSNANYISNFSQQQTIPTSVQIRLFKGTKLVDSTVTPIKFNAGSIFTVQQDAITAAVTASNGYTDTNIAQVNLTAQGLNTRVTAIEGDYVTSSQLTQTANQITMNVYDELNNKTGIDVANGQITLNANNTTIIGNLNITDTQNGITVFDSDGTPRIQLQPQQIGSIDNFNGGTTYRVRLTAQTQNAQAYTATTNKVKIGAASASDTLTISTPVLYINSYDNDGVPVFPTANTLTVQINLYQEGNNTAVQTYNTTFTKTSDGYYSASDITYSVPTTATYLIDATITCNEQPRTYMYAQLTTHVNQTIQHQTYIGTDGFYCNPYTNAYLWAGSEEIQMRWLNAGIRVNHSGLQRLPSTLVQQNTLWLPADNFTHVTTVLNAHYTLDGNVYKYNMNPVTDKGLMSCYCPSWDETGKTTRLYLPPLHFTYDGVSYTLPSGYKVDVVNVSAVGRTITMLTRHYVIVTDESGNDWNVKGEVITFVHLGQGVWASTPT